jgi:murein L,D-transpeptidase YcbB/YkuD
MRTTAVTPFLSAVFLALAVHGSACLAEAVVEAPGEVPTETVPPVPSDVAPNVTQMIDNGAPSDPVAQAIQKMLMPPAPLPNDPPPAPVAVKARVDMGRALLHFYLQRGFRSAWSDEQDVVQLMNGLARTALDGLAPADFHAADLARLHAQAAQPTVTAEQQAQFDIAATRTCLEALLALRRGKVDPVRLDMAWNAEPIGMDPREDVKALFAAIDGHRVAQAFNQAPPREPLYTNLRQGLARLRAVEAHGGWAPIASTVELAPGVVDPAVKTLRARLVAGGYLEPRKGPGTTFDAPLTAALKKFQGEQYLPVTGRLTPVTLAALNVPVQERIDQVRVNMERARWLLYKLDGTFVVVDIAGYKMALYRDGKAIWRSRVQVGKPVRNTPMFQSQITYVTFNPTWTVPPTILVQDVLPKILKNPNYLAANHMRVLDRQGLVVNPATVDWRTARGLTLRQDAGPTNSLGQVVIRFPNPYSIYLHDTPHRELFKQEMRATSSGCIRVEHPLQLVELLFNDPEHWGAEAIQAQLATGKTANVHLPIKIPVLLAYWTVDLGEQGRVAYKPDVYGQDQALLRALNRPIAAPLAGL